MNKHFHDARYYLQRAGEHAKLGVHEELEPVEERVRALAGGDDQPEPTGVERLREELADLEATAEDEARETLARARETLAEYRESRAAA